jgi:hypothetical protein
MSRWQTPIHSPRARERFSIQTVRRANSRGHKGDYTRKLFSRLGEQILMRITPAEPKL